MCICVSNVCVCECVKIICLCVGEREAVGM